MGEGVEGKVRNASRLWCVFVAHGKQGGEALCSPVLKDATAWRHQC